MQLYGVFTRVNVVKLVGLHVIYCLIINTGYLSVLLWAAGSKGRTTAGLKQNLVEHRIHSCTADLQRCVKSSSL